MAQFRWEGRTAVVTGGSAGIGLELTKQLIAKGVRVIIVGRDEAKIQAAVHALGDAVTGVRADLSHADDIDRLIADLPAQAPDLSVLINNAGSQLLTDFLAGDGDKHLAALRDEIAANFTSVVGLSIGLLPLLRRQPAAAIVNVTSGLALAPKKSSPVYCATKAGVRTFTRALRYQCEDGAPHVRVIEALPPIVDTAMTRGRGSGKISPAACAAEIIAGVSAGRVEINVGKSKLLAGIMRLSPALGQKIMRDG